eukprot:UN27012
MNETGPTTLVDDSEIQKNSQQSVAPTIIKSNTSSSENVEKEMINMKHKIFSRCLKTDEKIFRDMLTEDLVWILACIDNIYQVFEPDFSLVHASIDVKQTFSKFTELPTHIPHSDANAQWFVKIFGPDYSNKVDLFSIDGVLTDKNLNKNKNLQTN